MDPVLVVLGRAGDNGRQVRRVLGCPGLASGFLRPVWPPEVRAGRCWPIRRRGTAGAAAARAPSASTRLICTSPTSQSKCPLSGSRSCHLSDQSRYHVTPALAARRINPADAKAWLIPQIESLSVRGGTSASRSPAPASCRRPPLGRRRGKTRRQSAGRSIARSTVAWAASSTVCAASAVGRSSKSVTRNVTFAVALPPRGCRWANAEPRAGPRQKSPRLRRVPRRLRSRHGAQSPSPAPTSRVAHRPHPRPHAVPAPGPDRRKRRRSGAPAGASARQALPGRCQGHAAVRRSGPPGPARRCTPRGPRGCPAGAHPAGEGVGAPLSTLIQPRLAASGAAPPRHRREVVEIEDRRPLVAQRDAEEASAVAPAGAFDAAVEPLQVAPARGAPSDDQPWVPTSKDPLDTRFLPPRSDARSVKSRRPRGPLQPGAHQPGRAFRSG